MASHPKCSHVPLLVVASASASSTGSIPFARTSQKRKRRMPVAPALSSERILVEVLRIRPRGKPRKTVKPAIAPSARISPIVIAALVTPRCDTRRREHPFLVVPTAKVSLTISDCGGQHYPVARCRGVSPGHLHARRRERPRRFGAPGGLPRILSSGRLGDGPSTRAGRPDRAGRP